MGKQVVGNLHTNEAPAWIPVEIVGDFEEEDVLRAAQLLGHACRILGSSKGRITVELHVSQFSESEPRFRQALTDQRLRRAIEARASKRVSELVDAVIGKVTGA